MRARPKFGKKRGQANAGESSKAKLHWRRRGPRDLSQPDPAAHTTTVRVLTYGLHGFEELNTATAAQIEALHKKAHQMWVDVVGLLDVALIEQICRIFHVHRLALEDVLNPGQRAKLEDFDNHLFITMHMIDVDEDLVRSEQFSLFIGDRFVLTFQQFPRDCFDGIRDRIREGRGRIRSAGSDYLAYLLLDSIVDDYFPLLEKYEQSLEDIEEVVLGHDESEVLEQIHHIRRDLRLLRRMLWPLENVLEKLMLEKKSFMGKETRFYMRDCLDHVIHVVDALDALRDLASNVMDYHLSMLNNRLNEIVKVLTVVTAIFIPLTFVVGVYGMNFEFMPELRWRYGYAFAWGVMIVVTAAMLYFFKRKKWL